MHNFAGEWAVFFHRNISYFLPMHVEGIIAVI